jgi:hypothetical protein
MSYLMPIYKASDPATTVRPSSTSLFTVDSEDRWTDYIEARAAPYSGTTANVSPYDFQIRRSESLMNGFASRLAVTEINFPWAIPNINAKTYNMNFSYTVAGQPSVAGLIQLLPGFTAPAVIAAAIQAYIRLEDPTLATFNFTYGEGGDPVFSYQTNSTTVIAFTPFPYESPMYPWPVTTKQLFDLLGFTNTNAIQSIGGNGNFTLCQSVRYVDIVCPTLVYNQANPDTMSQKVARNALCRIYLGDGAGTGQSTVNPISATFCPPGCAPLTIYRNFTQPKQIQWLGNQPIPGTLRFTVYDDTGAPLTELFEGGALQGEYLDWSMTILVSEN